MKKPIVWSIASFDPTGLSGMQADLETLSNFKVNPYSIITALSVQNKNATTKIEAISSDHIMAQCDALQYAFKPNAIKIGMIGESAAYDKISYFLLNFAGFVIFDPILTCSLGTALIFSNIDKLLISLVKLFNYADIVTLNFIEAEIILQRTINSYQDIEVAAHTVLSLGAKSVLLKGNNIKDTKFCQDYWTNGKESFWLANQRLPNKNYPGMRCAFASAIAACLTLNHSIKDAIVIAKMYVNRGMRQAIDIDEHTAKFFHSSWPKNEIDLPYIASKPLLKLPEPFKICPMGFYPIVDSSNWVEKLVLAGVKYIQLRVKNTHKSFLEEEIKRSIFLAKKLDAILFINDFWELAIRFGAAGIHLGQEDLLNADINKIYQAGLYLGVSTHCYYEVAIAHTLNPSYIACGPIYPTISKVMTFKPQGIKQLKRWRHTLHYPLVAIGGINLDRLSEVLKTGVNGIALISAITKSAHPLLATQQFLKQIREFNHG